MSAQSDWLHRQSAVIPFLMTKGKVEIVLVTSSSSKRWVIPKGIIEPDLTPEDSAAKEALEEAGVVGKVSSNVIFEYEYKKWGGICQVKVYSMAVSEVLDVWDEMDLRDRKIVPLSEAIKIIKPVQRKVLEQFKFALGRD